MQGSVCHVLVVDEPSASRRAVVACLDAEGFSVRTAASPSEARALLTRESVDVVLLDVGQCRADAAALIGELRGLGGAGVILVSDCDDHSDRVCGLEVGADDCVSQPVRFRELRARVRNLANKTRALRQAGAFAPPTSPVRFAGWALDIHRHQLTSPLGQPLHLTSGEFTLLAVLAANPGRVLSREWLLEQVSRKEPSPASRSVDVAVAQLRRKLGDDPRRPSLIATVHGVGYRFLTEVE